MEVDMDTSDIEVTQRGEFAVVQVKKPMLTSMEADRLLQTLRSYHEQTGSVRFVIDMEAVDFLDSACIGSLVTFLIEIDKCGGKLMLASCQKGVEDLLKITGLTTHIRLLASVEQADELDLDNDQAGNAA
jgi:anti-anti-sigma factor